MAEHPVTTNVRPLLENLFRRESGRLTASLTRFFGSNQLELAEDVVQDTLLKAMREWPFKGIPDDPAAWLHRVAKNGAIDRLRRDARGMELLQENAPMLRSEWTLASTVHAELSEGAIVDDQLRMFFACCHPALPADQQVALVLKTLCGFSVPEIARAFLTNEETVNKRLHRARRTFRELGKLEIPQGDALNERLEQVLAAIYLLFNEGYHSTTHAELIREELIEEALRLNHLLLGHRALVRPQVHALHALMCYHASRTDARRDPDGTIILLRDQDRSRWDRAMIELGNEHLTLASEGNALTSYHIEAAIASLYANAASYEQTDWAAIVHLYDSLLHFKPAPLIRVNRAIAIGLASGAEEGLRAIEVVEELRDHGLYHAARGDMLAELGRNEEAHDAYERAIQLTKSEAEAELLACKLRALVQR